MGVHLNQQNTRQSGVWGHLFKGSTSQVNEFISVTKSLALFLAIAFLLRASVVEAFKIPSASMVPTLEIGDHILVNKLAYGLRVPFLATTAFQWRLPKRGDVVVFTLPDNPLTPEIDESDTNIIKRVIGLPGETIKVTGMTVYINDKPYQGDEKHARWLYGGKKDFGPVTIPENRVFLMGDNRDASKDSRFWDDPFLDVSRIKGRAFIIYWSGLWTLSRMFQLID